MTFDVRAGSADMQYSVHDFPGDETVDMQDYRRIVFSGYISSVSTAYGAARGCGLSVDAETFERWKRCGAAAGLLDDFIDESPDVAEANDLYQSGLADILDRKDDIPVPEWVDSRLGAAVLLLRNSVDVLPEIQRDNLVVSARAIGSIAVLKARCSDVHEYISILKTEGRHTASLVSESASEYVHDQPGFPSFATWCKDALEFATLADSARDLWTDKKDGLVNVEATVRNGLRIALNMRPPARRLYRRQPARRATLAGLAARMTFSKRPTEAAMRQFGANAS